MEEDDAQRHPGQADAEAGDDVGQEVDAEVDPAEPDQEDDEDGNGERTDLGKPGPEMAGGNEPERAVDGERDGGVAARERVRALRRERVGEEGTVTLESELEADRDDLGADPGQHQELQLGDPAFAPEEGGAEDDDDQQRGDVPKPRDVLEERGPPWARLFVEPGGDAVVDFRVPLGQVLGHPAEDPGAAGEDDQPGDQFQADGVDEAGDFGRHGADGVDKAGDSGWHGAIVTLTRMRSVIVSAVRTPFGKLGGGLKDLEATELGSIAIRNALDRIGLENDEVEYVVMGQVLQGGAGQAPARQAAIGAGLPIEVPADTINKVCASSIRAVEIADQMIRAGDHHVVVAGGMESMSNAPYILKEARFGYRLGDGSLIDLMTHDGLTSTFDKKHMVEQASFVARELGISREDQDAWALRSHERAVDAIDGGRFKDEIVPVGELEEDEGPRRDTSIERLAKLKPVFDPEGTTTAGNAPGVNDGAGALIVTSEEFAKTRGLEPLATILSQGYVADDFAYLARTPANAGHKALEKAGKSIDDVERIELNEAFSSVALNSTKMLGADPEKVNVNGGAVALGHPIGASGARILSTMIYELRRNGGGLGLAAICSGGGQGDALLIEV